MLFLSFRIREYDQTTVILIDSEDTYVVVLCAYTASIINGELGIRCEKNKGPLLKKNLK